MKASKQSQAEPTPAAQLETARAEHEAAQTELAALDIHKGALNEAAGRRRELQELAEIARERLQVAQSRFDEYEYGRIEGEIAALQEDAAQVENELAIAREEAERDLRERFNGDWLAGTGRYSTQRPAVNELLGHCTSVCEVEGRRDLIHAQIRSLERRIIERRQERERQAVAARVDARKRLVSGESVAVDLVPWKIIPATGFTGDVADGLERRAIPCALPDHHKREVHALLPEGEKPGSYADGFMIESAEPMPHRELCPPMADAWQRSRGRVKAAR